MKINFITTKNHGNGYGMTREYFKKFLPLNGIEISGEQQDVALILNTPPGIIHAKSKIKILYTMIEGDAVPPSWIEYLEMADHVVVPTTFVQKAFKKAGIESTVIPLGYDKDLFKPVKRNNPVYTFLHYEAFQDRKGWKDLLYAWMHSGLAENEFECQLVLKTVQTFDYVYKALEDEMIALPYNVKIICGELPHKSMPHLLETADCFVFPSRGEGFSLPPIEAMATGLPVILTKGHSHMDYYNEDYMYGVDCDIKVPARYHDWEDEGNFVRCTAEDLGEILKHVYENQDEAKEKGRASVEYVKEYRYDKSVSKLAKFIWHAQEA